MSILAKSPTAFLHNEIDSVINLGVREREVIAIDAVSGRVREIHNKPPLARSSAFGDYTKSAYMEERKRRPGKETSDVAKADFAGQVLIHDLGILESGLHFLSMDWSLAMRRGGRLGITSCQLSRSSSRGTSFSRSESRRSSANSTYSPLRT